MVSFRVWSAKRGDEREEKAVEGRWKTERQREDEGKGGTKEKGRNEDTHRGPRASHLAQRMRSPASACGYAITPLTPLLSPYAHGSPQILHPNPTRPISCTCHCCLGSRVQEIRTPSPPTLVLVLILVLNCCVVQNRAGARRAAGMEEETSFRVCKKNVFSIVGNWKKGG